MDNRIFNPIGKLTDMGKRKYLMVTYRLIWFHQEKPEWAIESDLHEISGQFYVKAVIRDEVGRIRATGLATMRSAGKSEKSWEGREIEKCETAAIGRALERCGYSTGSAILRFAGQPKNEMPDFVNDDDEGDHLSSAPIDDDTPPANMDTKTGEVVKVEPPATKSSTAPDRAWDWEQVKALFVTIAGKGHVAKFPGLIDNMIKREDAFHIHLNMDTDHVLWKLWHYLVQKSETVNYQLSDDDMSKALGFAVGKDTATIGDLRTEGIRPVDAWKTVQAWVTESTKKQAS